MKHLFLSFLSLFFLGLTAIAVLGGWGVHKYLSAGPLQESKIILIERGSGVSTIARQLEKEDVISEDFLFKIAARFGGSLKAGEYEFTPQMPMAEIIKKMQEGDVFDRKITVPEGFTSWQVVNLLNAREELTGKIQSIPAEGTLMPNTYHFVSGEDRNAIISRMQAATKKAMDELWETRAENLPIKNKAEALILASIIEKETGVDEERETVAGVFVNRLRKGMPLQTDPTVIYAITKGKIQTDGRGPLGRRLLRKDLQIDDPYNTYKYPGLPPGPIANPGYDSIKAALNPEENDYIFFVADGTGGHLFAKTLAEHNRNVANWRKIRRSQ
jgi:UPF0755 protein